MVLMMRMRPEHLIESEERQDWSADDRHRGLFQGLHARRLPCRPVRTAHAPPAVPLPPVAVRRHRRSEGHLRSGVAPAAAAADRASTTEGYLIAQSDFTEPVGPSFWEMHLSTRHRREEGTARRTLRRRNGELPRRANEPVRARQGAAAVRSSPTTGRSCSARSRSGRSSWCSSRAPS